MLVRAKFERRQSRRDQGSLRRVEMPTMKIEADNERRWVGAHVLPCPALDVCGFRSAPTISAVKNLAVEKPDRLANAVLAHICHQLIVRLIVKQGKDVGERMESQIRRVGCHTKSARRQIEWDYRRGSFGGDVEMRSHFPDR